MDSSTNCIRFYPRAVWAVWAVQTVRITVRWAVQYKAGGLLSGLDICKYTCVVSTSTKSLQILANSCKTKQIVSNAIESK